MQVRGIAEVKPKAGMASLMKPHKTKQSCRSPVYYSVSPGTIPSLGVRHKKSDQKTIQATNLGKWGVKEEEKRRKHTPDLPFH